MNGVTGVLHGSDKVVIDGFIVMKIGVDSTLLAPPLPCSNIYYILHLSMWLDFPPLVYSFSNVSDVSSNCSSSHEANSIFYPIL